MNDELEALLRDHYRAAADHITAGPGTVRRFQDAGRAAAPERRTRWRWAFPALAAAVTAAVLVTIALFLWPGGGGPAKPQPMAPPASPSVPGPREPTATLERLAPPATTAQPYDPVLDAALAALPARQRAVVVLRYWCDLSEEEIAHTLGISRGTVKSHTARALAAVRQRLTEGSGR